MLSSADSYSEDDDVGGPLAASLAARTASMYDLSCLLFFIASRERVELAVRWSMMAVGSDGSNWTSIAIRAASSAAVQFLLLAAAASSSNLLLFSTGWARFKCCLIPAKVLKAVSQTGHVLGVVLRPAHLFPEMWRFKFAWDVYLPGHPEQANGRSAGVGCCCCCGGVVTGCIRGGDSGMALRKRCRRGCGGDG